MKVLIVCSGNTPAGENFELKLHQAFIYEQVESLRKLGIEINYFIIKGKGLWGYFKHYKLFMRILGNNYDIVHAHNGFSGFISNLQKRVPVVTTYHGSDINLFYLRIVSYFPIIQSAQNIFVSKKQRDKLLIKRNDVLIPCGVELSTFRPSSTNGYMNFGNTRKHKKQILFSSVFSNPIKNSSLALSAIEKLIEYDIELLELKNKTRDEVCNLMNIVDLLLLTSFSEGSPMVIKEAMACNCPIVSTDVGDVREVFGTTAGCYICSFDPLDVAEKIEEALKFSEIKNRTDGRKRIVELELDSQSIAKKVKAVYEKVLLRDDR